MTVSGEQRRNTAIPKHVSIFPQAPPPSRQAHNPYLVLDVRGNDYFSLLSVMLAIGLSYMIFIMLRYVPSVSLCPAAFCTPRPNLPVVAGISGLPTFAFQSPIMKRTSFSPLVIVNTLFQQHKRRLYIWTSSDDQYQNQIDYILCSQKWRSSIESAETRLGADCGSDHKLRIAKFRLKLKKVGKTTRPFRYDLNPLRLLYNGRDKQIQGVRSDRHSA